LNRSLLLIGKTNDTAFGLLGMQLDARGVSVRFASYRIL